jgi:hypothetical protein
MIYKRQSHHYPNPILSEGGLFNKLSNDNFKLRDILSSLKPANFSDVARYMTSSKVSNFHHPDIKSNLYTILSISFNSQELSKDSPLSPHYKLDILAPKQPSPKY